MTHQIGESRNLLQKANLLISSCFLRLVLHIEQLLFTRFKWYNMVLKGEWLLFGFICVVIIGLHVILFLHMGAFWRDEASSIHVASSQTFGIFWNSLIYDSFPALFDILLKLWISSGIGKTEEGLRLFGTFVSVGIIIAIFYACRWLSNLRETGVPLLALSLGVFNISVFYYGSSIRAYGLASLLIVLCLAAFWRLVQNPNIKTGAMALLLAMLSVHSNYQNTYMLFGIGLAGATACAVCSLWKRSLLVLGLCFVTALSMLVYLPVIKAYKVYSDFGSEIVSLPLDVFFRSMRQSLAGESTILFVLWTLLLILSVLVLSLRFFSQFHSDIDRGKPSLDLYCLVGLIVAGVTGIVLFKQNGKLPHPWHFIPFIVFAAVILEVGFRSKKDFLWLVLTKWVVTCIILGLSLPQIWNMSFMRRTNMDLMTQTVAILAKPGDLILVNPFWFINSFYHYYDAEVNWITIPAYNNDNIYNFKDGGPIRKLMQNPKSLEVTKQRIASTLANGKQLWIVGYIKFLEPGKIPPTIGPPPDPQFGASWDAYSLVWTLQIGYFIQQHSLQAHVIPLPIDQPVNKFEKADLIWVTGWR